ncbi:MAG: hypothetical protein MUF63_00890 [Rhodobacteraceae bacterium]|jgi:hypothetical protein|nr:hypothetical protein [Paracoccaceae bacterium]
MRREKLGRIFEVSRDGLPAGCVSHAQSPQTLPLEDGIRIYFSTRSIDPEGGKFRSHVGFVDMDRDFRRILRRAERPVLGPAALGAFDEHGVFPMAVLRRGDEVWGYTTGWNRRVSVSVDTAIGLAVSRDGGLTFERQGDGPIVGPSLHEPFLVGDGFVVADGGRFHMWYIFGTHWSRETAGSPPDRVYKIGHAVSDDGVAFRKEDGRRVISDVLGPDECQALPSVARFGDRWHMVFCYREMHGFRTDPAKGYRIGYAWSSDLATWTRDDAALGLKGTPGDWDADMQCYPHLCVCDDRLFLLYNGNAFGRDGFGLARLWP